MKSRHELADQMSERTHAAAHLLLDIVAGETPLDREAVARVRVTLQEALCAATSLESELAGNPPPKEG